MSQNRRNSRVLALKLLYSVELNDGQTGNSTILRFDNFKEDIDLSSLEYAKVIFNYAFENISKIDDQLKSVIDNWSYERLSVVDKSLLRIGCAEMSMKEVPSSVVINELLEIAKIYGDSKTSSFINGILDAWHKKYL